MPFGMCPLCGQTMHMSVDAEWYSQRHPGLPQGSLVPAKCFNCWQELKVGDSVVVHKAFAEGPNPRTGEEGVIKGISTAEDGSLFLVLLSCGKEVYMIRAQLRKLRESEVRLHRSAE